MLIPPEQAKARVEQAGLIVAWSSTAIAATLMVVLLWSRLAPLNLSLWHDEIVTVVRFMGLGPREILFGSYIPNNHVLFNLLTWTTVTIFGSGEWVFRIWSAVPGLLAIPIALLSPWRRRDRVVVVALAILLVTSPLILRLSIQARGYGLCFFAMSGLITFGDGVLHSASKMKLDLFVLFGLIGVLTLPVFVLPFAISASVLFFGCPKIRKRLFFTLLMAALICTLVYAPNIGDILNASQQEHGIQLSIAGIVTQPLIAAMAPSVELLLPGANPFKPFQTQPGWVQIVALVTSLGLIVPGSIRTIRRHRSGALLLIAPLLGSMVILFALRLYVAGRFLSFFSIPLLLMAAEGVAAVVMIGGRHIRCAVATKTALVVIGTALTVSFVVKARPIVQLPRENFKAVAATLKPYPHWPVISNSGRPAGIDYYVDREVEYFSEQNALEERLCGPGPYIYIHHPFRGLDPDLSCVHRLGVEKKRCMQRARGLWIDVWIVHR